MRRLGSGFLAPRPFIKNCRKWREGVARGGQYSLKRRSGPRDATQRSDHERYTNRSRVAARATVSRGERGELTDAQLLGQFVDGDDEAAEAAFAAIVGRHGTMVLRVCQTVLHDIHAAEDAFQATFLVLARKAWTLGDREHLSNWLYGVALRTARKARTAAARRRLRDGEAACQRSVAIADRPPGEGESRDERVRILHEEIGRLPGSYRSAIVVCYLEGMTQEQAARQLRLAESTVRGRLARARKLLGRRLTLRGVTLLTGLIAVGTAADAAAARLPEVTVETIARAARLFGKSGQATGGAVSATAQSIARGVLSTMWLTSLKTTTTVMVAVVAIATVGTVALTQRAAEAATPVRSRRNRGTPTGTQFRDSGGAFTGTGCSIAATVRYRPGEIAQEEGFRFNAIRRG